MVYIIAEAGVNHNGSLELAYQLIDIAVKSKADAIKFQTFNSKKLVSETAEKAEYQKETTGKNETQFDMLKKLELSYNDFKLISKRCDERGIEFISTPFDLESVDFLDSIGVKTFKVGSGDLTNFLLLKKIAEKNKKIILSTGMSSMDEVKKSVDFIKKYSSNELVVLHCVSCYPTQNKDLNLNCIKTMKNTLNVSIGFSDHTKDELASLYSVCAGAEYIEKHFTIDKNMDGPDHRASLNSEELNNFVKKIRECEVILGNGNKICTKNEEKNKKVVRRSLFFSRDLKIGDIITEKDLIALRPYDGICVSKYKEIVGKKLIEDVNKNSYVLKTMLENENSNLIDKDNYKSKMHKYIPGGAHTYSRGEDVMPSNIPYILKRGDGAYVWDLSNNKFLDYGMSLRANILGYNNIDINNAAIKQINYGNNLTRPSEIEYLAAKMLVELIPWIDMVKFAKNGSNVTTAAIKLARSYTGKKNIIMCKSNPFYSFDDWFIGTTPIKRGTLYDTKCPFLQKNSDMKFIYNDLDSVKKLFSESNDIACLIMEPCTNESPKIYKDGKNFLQKIKDICQENNAVFILDEMITGFRFDIKGAAHTYNVEPDLVTYGKAIANGFSLAVLGGKKNIMSLGDIITKNRERVFLLSSTHGAEMNSLGAMIENINFLKDNNVIECVSNYNKKLMKRGNEISKKLGLLEYFNFYGLYQRPNFITKDINKKNSIEFRTLFVQEMANNNILMPWISTSFSHKEVEMEETLIAIEKSLIIYKKALEEDVKLYIKSHIIKPVFRKFN